MSYKIKYCYDSGDSCGHYPDQIEYLELVHESKLQAYQNLLRIKAHYEMYREINSYQKTKSTSDILKRYQKEDWFTGDEYKLILYTDEGNPLQIYAPWCGYFETLNWVELEDDLSRIKFN